MVLIVAKKESGGDRWSVVGDRSVVVVVVEEAGKRKRRKEGKNEEMLSCL